MPNIEIILGDITRQSVDAIAAALIARRGQGVDTIRLRAENDKIIIELGEEKAAEPAETPVL